MITPQIKNIFRNMLVLNTILFSQAAFAATEVKYKVLKCHDGDTCQVLSSDNMKLKIRLIGIDAPEVTNRKNKVNQPYGLESKDFINNLIKGKSVTLKNYATDPFGRSLSEIFLEKLNVNLKMVDSGMAEVYKGKMDKNFDVTPYLEAEKKAKKEKIGIWSLPNYQSPKDFRVTHKN
ncbi:MAG: thermonuclease family protein [Silvanigrellaceae bacterium]|nr:thermonuclease family protein [Silvanigrellaceae bacterium]